MNLRSGQKTGQTIAVITHSLPLLEVPYFISSNHDLLHWVQVQRNALDDEIRARLVHDDYDELIGWRCGVCHRPDHVSTPKIPLMRQRIDNHNISAKHIAKILDRHRVIWPRLESDATREGVPPPNSNENTAPVPRLYSVDNDILTPLLTTVSTSDFHGASELDVAALLSDSRKSSKFPGIDDGSLPCEEHGADDACPPAPCFTFPTDICSPQAMDTDVETPLTLAEVGTLLLPLDENECARMFDEYIQNYGPQ